jgi:hypothetical protein
MDGSNIDAANLLETLYRNSGRFKEADNLVNLLGGYRSEYLAVCAPAGYSGEVGDAPRVILLAKFSPSYGIKAVKNLEEANDVIVLPWFYQNRNYQGPVEEGTFFLEVEKIGFFYWEEHIFSLGKNCEPGTVYSTAPFTELVKGGTQLGKIIRIAEQLKLDVVDPSLQEKTWIQNVEAFRMNDGITHDSVRIQFVTEMTHMHELESSSQPISIWALLNKEGRVLETVGHAGYSYRTVQDVIWSRWKFGTENRIGFILHDSVEGTSWLAKYFIVIISADGKISELEIPVADGGC